MRIKSPRDFWSGAMFIGFGLFALLWSLTNYRVGSALEMGPGFFPTILGGLLTLLGVVTVGRSIRLNGAPVPAFHWRSLVLIPGSAVVYGYLLNPLGLVLATIGLVLVAGIGGREFRWKETLMLGIALAVFSVAVFVKGLSMPFPIWPKLG